MLTICKYLLLGMALLLLVPHFVSAQFIRMNISIPAGLELRLDANAAKVLEAPGGSTTSKGTVRWMELRSRENAELCIYMRHDAPLTFGADSLLWLNDGSNNFSAAVGIPARWQGRHFNGLTTMKQMPPTYTHFSAWLGIARRATGVLTIEYH
jgi:hypothetical protein